AERNSAERNSAELLSRRTVPKVGLEPTRGVTSADFESAASAIPPLRPALCEERLPLSLAVCLCPETLPNFVPKPTRRGKRPRPGGFIPHAPGCFRSRKPLPGTPRLRYTGWRGIWMDGRGRWGRTKA